MASNEQPVLSFPSDTAAPVAVVPIFYIHEGDHPFCDNPSCVCRVCPEQMRALLLRVITGELKLRRTYRGRIIGRIE